MPQKDAGPLEWAPLDDPVALEDLKMHTYTIYLPYLGRHMAQLNARCMAARHGHGPWSNIMALRPPPKKWPA